MNAPTYVEAPRADPSLAGKLRRHGARLRVRRPLEAAPSVPIVSFSFDDAPATAARAGAEILEAAGALGTWYLCAGLFGREGPMGRYADAADARRLAEAGHEIGCHTFSHLECGPAGPGRIERDTAANVAVLEDLCGVVPATFAYPFGDLSAEAKRALAPRFRLMRAVQPGLVRRGSDLNQAPSPGVQGPEGEARAADWIDRATAGRAWLILNVHDVRAEPSPWGCRPEALARLVARARAQGCEILPVARALDRILGRP
jgi:peptidoglycan/xylan/chitin deacetylase (PgdA/CDA1 family)